MALYPVIVCGGFGTRLWPASRPAKPKQFMPLSGNRSLFQETVLRVAPLASGEGALIVVVGARHRDVVIDQLAEIEISAHILLEPEGRDSAAAMAVAAAWIHRRDSDGMAIFVASDHHIPDPQAFRSAVLKASIEAETAGRIVMLGVRPTHPSSAYGYIRPSGRGLSPVEAFVEKPGRELATKYIDAGYLWNSGNFIVGAGLLLSELKRFAPGVETAVKAALPPAGVGTVQLLAPAFATAQKISIDYAVMERTELASVLEVDFEWCDLGTWDAIADSGEGDVGLHVFEDTESCLVRAPDGVLVAALGVRNLAIIVEKDAVLVCDLARAQDVKRVVNRVGALSPRHLDFPQGERETLADMGARLASWLRLRALPLWSAVGRSTDGEAVAALSLEGRPIPSGPNERVVAAQIAAFAKAARWGWRGPDAFVAAEDDGVELDRRARGLKLLAYADMETVSPDAARVARAEALCEIMVADLATVGRLAEDGRAEQLEACLAWERISDSAIWRNAAARIAASVMAQFDLASQVEQPCVFGADGSGLFDPGCQLRWAGLLMRYGHVAGDADVKQRASWLYAQGNRGVSLRRQVVIDAVTAEGAVHSHRARLESQLHWLGAAIVMARRGSLAERQTYLQHAAGALRAVHMFLTPDGVWRDDMRSDGKFIDQSASALNLKRLLCAFESLAKAELIGDVVSLD